MYKLLLETTVLLIVFLPLCFINNIATWLRQYVVVTGGLTLEICLGVCYITIVSYLFFKKGNARNI